MLAERSKRVARVGFDGRRSPVSQIEEELASFERSAPPSGRPTRTGRRTWRTCCLPSHLAATAGRSRAAPARHERQVRRRFRHIERTLGEHAASQPMPHLEEMEALCQEAKGDLGARRQQWHLDHLGGSPRSLHPYLRRTAGYPRPPCCRRDHRVVPSKQALALPSPPSARPQRSPRLWSPSRGGNRADAARISTYPSRNN